jgi:glyoxylase-like metal-dependent hydrolase (beta-lactamase superfamily II)
LAGFHGKDDPFYKDRYGAKTWSVDAPYVSSFKHGDAPYFVPDQVIHSETTLPIRGARIVEITSATPRESLLFIDREGGILISGDCLQNWRTSDEYFNLPARIMMKLLGFIKPHNIGPGWLRFAKPDGAELKKLLDIEFDHVLPSHGTPVIGHAQALYEPKISAL